MFTHFPSLLLIPFAVFSSSVITYHNSTQKTIQNVYPGSLSHSLFAHLRSRRFSLRQDHSPPNSHPECAEGCCGRTHVCGLRGCAFKARCGVDCCPPAIVQDLKLRAQRLTLEAAGVAPDGAAPLRGPPHQESQSGRPPPRGPPENNMGSMGPNQGVDMRPGEAPFDGPHLPDFPPHGQHENHHGSMGPHQGAQMRPDFGGPSAPSFPPDDQHQNHIGSYHGHNGNQEGSMDRFGPPLSYRKDGVEGPDSVVVVVHEKPQQRSQQQQNMQHVQQPQQQIDNLQQRQYGRLQPARFNGRVERNPDRIRQPPSPPPIMPSRPSPSTEHKQHSLVDHPHNRNGGGNLAPHPHTNGPSGLAPSQGAFGPSNRGGFTSAANERRNAKNSNGSMQGLSPGRMTFSSKPQNQNLVPPPGKSFGPKRPPAFTNRPPTSNESPMIRPPAFGGGAEQNLQPPPGKSFGPKRPPAFTNRPPSHSESPMVRPPAFGGGVSEKEQMPFSPRVKRCCECCMPDCHHGCIRNGGCGLCSAGNQHNNNGIVRGARTKQHN